MFLLNGAPVSADMPFEADGVQYPANWITLAAPEEREAIGITEVADPPPFDPRFYLAADVPRPIEDVQAMYLAQIKSQAQSEIYRKYPAWHQSNVTSRGVELVVAGTLSAQEIEEVEGFKAMWDDIKAMRAHSDALESEMMALSFEELTTWQQHGWPAPPEMP